MFYYVIKRSHQIRMMVVKLIRAYVWMTWH